MGIILQAKQLNKTYCLGKDNHLQVLNNVNVVIERGEFISVMGPSGSGKSTFLYNISGMDKISSGSVTFNGQEIADLAEKELSSLRLNKMGFVFQQPHLLPNLSILDNIILSAYLAKQSSRQTINEKAIDLMKKIGIAELAHHDITQASGGQLQRVAICRALINQPKMIFGDEPTGALNSQSAMEVMEILANINELGTTILLVTHDVKIAAKTDRVLYMLDGSIIGEKRIGKYIKRHKDLKMREKILSGWLTEKGF
ncbi:ABC transporter ATP-binding protein [Pseudogracilibacillus auburnensis]|uniref:Putative ABC transport system ATP-binding protein n=1 Tax=Pseudogracilibacillus auburnensis TaxID=1494959 RepID=A0A2V3VKQ4_9BACI|nr:ABC transporter ATP-binding protein [Pseudogracilibacillus auburnensis]PXW82373.1 putative ABC transport system ATP-binding protein [Pseudogracilibacillus auburnensis]